MIVTMLILRYNYNIILLEMVWLKDMDHNVKAIYNVFAVCITAASYIKIILIETNKLQHLHIGKNDIGDNGMRQITEGLQQNNTVIKLKAYQCGFSVEGT